jgi:hypothetical protein
VSRNFGSRGLENKVGLKASWAETPKLEVPKYRKLKFRTPEKHRARQSSENFVKLKCLSFLFVLIINVVDCS